MRVLSCAVAKTKTPTSDTAEGSMRGLILTKLSLTRTSSATNAARFSAVQACIPSALLRHSTEILGTGTRARVRRIYNIYLRTGGKLIRTRHLDRSWHGEEFHRRNRFPMISEEGEPTFGRVSALVSSKGRSFSRRAQPSMRSTPCICGAPQFGFSVTMWKINSRTSFGVRLLPICLRTLAINRQYIREPVRCQRTTVSGVTTMRACFHPDQNRRTTRKPASRVTKPIRSGRNLLGFWVPNCN
jgi:hypothetical protein